jgi:predicted AAA+ superfamily ATPase
LPLSTSELASAGMLASTSEECILKGGYPRLYVQPITIRDWCSNYISTYIEKDVRQVLGITDVVRFQRFLQLCAARIGNLINYSDLARDCVIIRLVTPYYKNFNKRVIKSPKLYFYDTALACTLLTIRNVEELSLHPIRGALFESFIISEIFKYNFNNNEVPAIYFWRDVQGHEIDVVIEKSFAAIVPIEIKARKTVSDDFFKALSDWEKITNQSECYPYIVYNGTEIMRYKKGHIYPWSAIHEMLKEIYGI